MKKRLTPLIIVAILGLGCLLAACSGTPTQWYERGIAAAERGNWEEAARAFQRAGGLADAPERAAQARSLMDATEAEYEAARQAMRERRWFDAYELLQSVVTARPEWRAPSRDLERVTTELDALLAEAEEQMANGDPAAAAGLYAAAGTYREANAHADAARALATRLDSRYRRMVEAAEDEEWATALQDCQALLTQSPDYRDVSRLSNRYVRDAHRAAEQDIEAGRYTDALRILDAIVALDPDDQEALKLQLEARDNAIVELVGIHSMRRVVGTHRGLQLRLDAVEVRPEGELVVRATVTNVTSMPNHLNCLQNDEENTPLYLLTNDHRRQTPHQWACQRWKQREWDLRPGASQEFWWIYPPQEDLAAPFTLVFEPWGNAEIELTPR